MANRSGSFRVVSLLLLLMETAIVLSELSLSFQEENENDIR